MTNKEKRTSVYTLYWTKETWYPDSYMPSYYGRDRDQIGVYTEIEGVYTDGAKALKQARRYVNAWFEDYKIKNHSAPRGDRTTREVHRTITKDDYNDLAIMDDGDDSKLLFRAEYWNRKFEADLCLYISKTVLN